MFDDFDPGIDLSQWSGFGGVVGSTVLATNYGGSVSAPNSLWFGDGGSRYATTLPINTTSGGLISFSIRLANGSAGRGSGWTIFRTKGRSGMFDQQRRELDDPGKLQYHGLLQLDVGQPGDTAAAQAPAALFRWRQLSHSGASFDHWALDDVLILAEDMAPLITVQPQSQTVPVGDPVTLSVTAFGSQPLSYQWLKNGTNLDGATASSLVWTNVQMTDAGTYSVLVPTASARLQVRTRCSHRISRSVPHLLPAWSVGGPERVMHWMQWDSTTGYSKARPPLPGEKWDKPLIERHQPVRGSAKQRNP